MHARNGTAVSKYLPVYLSNLGRVRDTGTEPSDLGGPFSGVPTLQQDPYNPHPSHPETLLRLSLLTEEHFKKNLLSLRSIKVSTQVSYFVLYCLNNLGLILLHKSPADWAPLSSKDSSSTVGNRPAFTGAGSHPPPPSQHSFQSR